MIYVLMNMKGLLLKKKTFYIVHHSLILTGLGYVQSNWDCIGFQKHKGHSRRRTPEIPSLKALPESHISHDRAAHVAIGTFAAVLLGKHWSGRNSTSQICSVLLVSNRAAFHKLTINHQSSSKIWVNPNVYWPSLETISLTKPSRFSTFIAKVQSSCTDRQPLPMQRKQRSGPTSS